MLSEQINKFSIAENFTVLNVLHQSEHKCTAVLRVIYKDSTAIVKIWFEGASISVINSFQRERNYYQLFECYDEIPALLAVNDNYIILTEIVGLSLFEYYSSNVIDSNLASKHAESICNVIRMFNQPLVEHNIEQEKPTTLQLVVELLRKFKNLFFSGPKNTNNSLLERALLKFVFYITLPLVTLNIIYRAGFFRKKATGRRYHGDFHMNNILLNEQNEVSLIDFECTTERSLMLVDIVYCCATHSALCENWNDVIEEYSEAIQTDSKDSLTYLLKLFISAARMNQRFRSNRKNSNFSEISLYIKAILGIRHVNN